MTSMTVKKIATFTTFIPLAFALAACSTGSETATGPQPTGTASAITVDQASADLLPPLIVEAGVLNVAVNAHHTPMAFVAEDGHTITGLEAEITEAVATALGLEVEMTEAKLDAALAGIQAGRYDLAVGSITDTVEREAVVDMIDYAEYGQAIGTQAGSADGVDFDTACGLSVGSTNGSIQATKFLPDMSAACEAAASAPIDIQTYPDASASFLALTSGRIDAIMLNEPAVRYQVAQSDGLLELAAAGYSNDFKGFVAAKGTGLSEAVLSAVQYLADSGALQEVFERWGLPELESTPALNGAAG